MSDHEQELIWNYEGNKKWDKNLITKKIKVLKDNEIYRVADVKKFLKSHPVVREILRSKKYKKTLLRKYFQGNYMDLYDVIVENKDTYNLKYFDDDYVVVHLRTGDDLKERGLTIPNMVKILKKLKQYDKDKKVIIITAMHYGHHRTSNKFYSSKNWCYNDENYKENIKRIHYFISKLEHELYDIVSNENIDYDIMHLTFCKNLVFCESSGAFANAVGEWHQKYFNLDS